MATKKIASVADKKVMSDFKAQKLKNQNNQAAYAKTSPARAAYFDKQKSLGNAVAKERATANMAKNNLPNIQGMRQGLTNIAKPSSMFGAGIGKNPKTQAEQNYKAHSKTYSAMNKSSPLKKGGMAKTSGNLPGLDKLRKFEANPANKAEVAKRAAFADKMKSDMTARQSANSDKVQAMKAQADAAKARQTAKTAPKPAMPARPTGLGAAVRGGAPALKFGTSGGMGSMAGRGGMGARAGMTRPAMTPQVKQGLQGMSDKLRAMPMKKGGKAGKK